MRKHHSLPQGFTLIEMIVSIAVIAVFVVGVGEVVAQVSNNVSWLTKERFIASDAVSTAFSAKTVGKEIFSNYSYFLPSSVRFDSALFRNASTQQTAPFTFLGAEDSATLKTASPQSVKGYLVMHRFPMLGGMAMSGSSLFSVDLGNHMVRNMNLSTLANSVVTGSGGNAGFSDSLTLLRNPQGVALDENGVLWIADFGNRAIRKWDGATLLTVVGTGSSAGNYDGVLSDALLGAPSGIAASGSTIYFTDFENHTLRQIAGGSVSTRIGTGEKGNNGDISSTGTGFSLAYPTDVSLGNGGLLIADFGNRRLLHFSPISGIVRTLASGLDVISAAEGSGEIFISGGNQVTAMADSGDRNMTPVYTFGANAVVGKILAPSSSQLYVWVYDPLKTPQSGAYIARLNKTGSTWYEEPIAGNITSIPSFFFPMKPYDLSAIKFSSAYDVLGSEILTKLEVKRAVAGGAGALALLTYDLGNDDTFLFSALFAPQ